ncbi:MAG: hypothetical protein WB780_09700 [Candidatus Acidiferrales bacterium]
MKQRVAILTVLILAVSLHGESKGGRLRGCLGAERIAEGVAKLRGEGWQNLTVARLRSIWPVGLDPLDCGASDCRSVVRQGRVIDGHCECCEVFEFMLLPGEDKTRVEQLHNVIIHYTAGQQKEAVEVAKQFAKAAGLSDTELAAVGGDTVQKFGWWNPAQNQQEHFGIEIHFTRRGHLWEVYFAVGRDETPPQSPQ